MSPVLSATGFSMLTSILRLSQAGRTAVTETGVPSLDPKILENSGSWKFRAFRNRNVADCRPSQGVLLRLVPDSRLCPPVLYRTRQSSRLPQPLLVHTPLRIATGGKGGTALSKPYAFPPQTTESGTSPDIYWALGSASCQSRISSSHVPDLRPKQYMRRQILSMFTQILVEISYGASCVKAIVDSRVFVPNQNRFIERRLERLVYLFAGKR